MIRKGDFKLLVLLLFICHGTVVLSQNLTSSYLDSLGYEELLTEFNSHEGDSISQETIARAYLERARADKDSIKMARGYDRLARIFHPERNIMYADSVIYLTRESNNITYPAMGYILKGYNYSLKRDVVESNKNYFQAYQISKDRNNIQQQVYVMDILISDKLIWGNKNEALNLQYKRNQLINDSRYLDELIQTIRPEANIDIKQLYLNEKINSTLSFVFCHLTLKNYDSTEIYINKGFELLEDYKWVNKAHFYNWLNEVKVEMYSKLGNHYEVEKSAQILFKNSKTLSNHSLLNIFHHYGVSEIQRGNIDKGYDFLLKSDSILKLDESLLLPSDRDLLVNLKEYYRSRGDISKQIVYLNRLIKADSIMKINYKYFEPNVIRLFETPVLLDEKEKLIKELRINNKSSRNTIHIIIFLLAMCLLGLFYYYMREQTYKKRFQQLVNEMNNPEVCDNKNHSYKVSKDVINSILLKLENFESNHEYLTHLSLHSLSRDFDTNPNYLSRVINMKMEKNFSQYINDLRIEYAMNNLLNDPKLRKYTIKAIAEECGYRNSESFSKAFYKRNGIYPSYYIKQLEKSKGSVNRDN